MNKTREELIAECQLDIQIYEQCGKVLYGYSWSRIVNLQMSIDEITLHYGIEYGKAMMKLRTLLDDRHNDNEIAERLKQIDADIHAMEEALKHDLDFRGLLIHL